MSFATWFLTPFDPRTEIRVPEFGSFKNEVAVQLKKKKKPEAEVADDTTTRHDTTHGSHGTHDTRHTTHDTNEMIDRKREVVEYIMSNRQMYVLPRTFESVAEMVARMNLV